MASRRSLALHMFPTAPPLWEKHRQGDVVGVSDDPPGETYWKVANGIRLTGMPAYKELLTRHGDVAGERFCWPMPTSRCRRPRWRS